MPKLTNQTVFLRIQCQNKAEAVILEHERQRVRALRNSSNQIQFASKLEDYLTKTIKYRESRFGTGGTDTVFFTSDFKNNKCELNPNWQIQENSSRNFPEISVFQGGLLENSSSIFSKFQFRGH